jgi:hypothetical protein
MNAVVLDLFILKLEFARLPAGQASSFVVEMTG